MKNIRIDIEYDGTNFMGFQRQLKGERTVQGEIENCIYKLLNQKVNLIASGRTDRGVHAINQVINFFCDSKIPLKNLMYCLNNILPKDILIKNLTEENKDFNARFSAIDRAYIYKMKIKQDYNVFEKNYFTYIDSELDEFKSNEILKQFKGVHNFESFRMSDCNANNPIREIKEIYLYKKNNEMIIYIKANAFLKSMIRIIVGSFLEVYFEKKEKNYIKDRLENPGMYKYKLLSPPQGLYLYEINY